MSYVWGGTMQRNRGNDPAASERVIVPLPQQMDDEEIDTAYKAEQAQLRMLDEEHDERGRQFIGRMLFLVAVGVGILVAAICLKH